MKKSTTPTLPSSTAHPDSSCPLWLHPSGRWTIKRRGRQFYFGKDAKEAHKLWEAGQHWYEQGQLPPDRQDVPRVRDLLNKFLTARLEDRDSGDLAYVTFRDYERACRSVADFFGRYTPVGEAFTLVKLKSYRLHVSKRLIAPTSLKVHLRKVATILKWAYEHQVVNTPIATGGTLKPAKLRRIREYKREHGQRFLEPSEVRKILEITDPVWKAAILLGVNCGFGNTDIARLRVGDIDLDKGWIEYPRPKTGVMRRCPLWPETVEAIRQALRARPKPAKAKDRDLVFLSARGLPLVRVTENGAVAGHIPEIFDRILRAAGVKKPGIGFYTLRHCFRSAATLSRDREAADFIMGHSRGDMAENYIHYFPDDRLEAVSDAVRGWLFGEVPVSIPMERKADYV